MSVSCAYTPQYPAHKLAVKMSHALAANHGNVSMLRYQAFSATTLSAHTHTHTQNCTGHRALHLPESIRKVCIVDVQISPGSDTRPVAMAQANPRAPDMQEGRGITNTVRLQGFHQVAGAARSK